MKVRVGIVDTERVVDLEIDDTEDFGRELSADFEAQKPLLWFTDNRGRRVAVPLDKVAFVEIEGGSEQQKVGFATGV